MEHCNFIDFSYYQDEAGKTAIYEHPLYPVLGLAEETGEVCGKVAKVLRGDNPLIDTDAMAKELGDVLWMLAMCCKELGIDLADVAELNLRKLQGRAKANTLQGDGDDR
jgi:NTP pyrophosphatase (non-canonical NTP hydrolase)